jgi:hypothetical protein
MGVEVRAVASQNEHEKQFRIHARGWNLMRGEVLNGGGQGLL